MHTARFFLELETKSDVSDKKQNRIWVIIRYDFRLSNLASQNLRGDEKVGLELIELEEKI